MKHIYILVLTTCFLIMLAPSGQAQFILSGEFRPRAEYRDGYSKLRDSNKTPYADILGRNRLIFDYKNDALTARFSVQQAYVYGENNYSSDTITRNTVNVYEAWFRYAFSKSFAIKTGRMELIYDDSRILGNSNWGPKGATHDMVLLQWEAPKAGYKGDLGIAINNSAPASAYLGPYLLKNYKYMGYLYEQKKFLKDNLVFSVLGVLDVFQKPASSEKKSSVTGYSSIVVTNSNHDTIGTSVVPVYTTTTFNTPYPNQLYGRFTFGGTGSYTWKNLKVFASAYYQAGHLSDGKKISAGFFGGYASYRIVKPFTVLAGYERFTGNDYSDVEGRKTKSNSFAVLYPSSHGFYGYMDMFSTQTTSGNTAGLTDIYGKLTYSFTEKASVEATYRMFGLAKGYLPVTTTKPSDLPYVSVSKNLGSEVDLMVLYKPVPSLELNAAYCFFLPTSTMERLNDLKTGTAKWAQYAYIQLTFRPTFFNSDKH
ncbi:MAG TPA: hypothetical protein PLK82_09945 [Bacteroidales bacterium]|nr:hypothetical protein [Bacteroidales bacterium]